jgi:hypothetical protein
MIRIQVLIYQDHQTNQRVRNRLFNMIQYYIYIFLFISIGSPISASDEIINAPNDEGITFFSLIIINNILNLI